MTTAPCFTCGYIDTLQNLRTAYESGLFAEIAARIKDVVKSLMVLYLLSFGARMLITGDASKSKNVGISFVVGIFIITAVFTDNGTPVTTEYIIHPIESMSLSLCALFIQHGNPQQATNIQTYGNLLAVMEGQIRPVFDIFPLMLSAHNPLDVAGALSDLLAGVLLVLPFLIVAMLFIGFATEALLYFFAMGAVSPLLLCSVLFPLTRDWSKTGLKLIFCAAFTLIFIGLSFGFTASAITSYIAKLTVSLENSTTTAPPPTCTTYDDAGTPIQSQAPECQPTANTAQPQTYGYKPWSAEYFGFVMVGLASIVFHLAARSLAQNLAQVSSGPGAVGAVIAGAVGTAGAGVMMIARASNFAAFGREGIGGVLGGAAGNLAGRVGIDSSHGAVGALTSGATSIFNALGGSGGSGSSPLGATAPRAPTPSPMSSSPMAQAMDKQTKALEELTKFLKDRK